jgi:argininosuccinate lyase
MTEKLWGSRFSADITAEVLEYTLTVDVDERLVSADLWQDIAHTLMLGRQHIIPDQVARSILGALLRLHDQDKLELRREYEDVHLNIEHMVISELGLPVGGHMHTARSRNDQVSTDMRMYLRETARAAAAAGLDLIEALLDMPEDCYGQIIPGYTHSQAAQPITVAFWKTAHASMLLRDVDRTRDCISRINESPLGACALAGTSFPIDRDLTTLLLGFARPLANALDATSARDHVIEFAAVLAIGGNTLSRMAEEIVLWSGYEYGLCEVADEFATGSSIMPQKKNPVVAELVRGRAGRTVGTLVQLLSAVKGITLGYSCDLQEDKPYLWNSIDTYLTTLRIVRDQAEGLQFNAARGEELCWDNFSTATELANYLVTDKGLPFREAHRITGHVVGQLIKRGVTLREAGAVRELLVAEDQDIDEATLTALVDPRAATARYGSAGSTSPASVRAEQAQLMSAVTVHRDWIAALGQVLEAAHAGTIGAARDIIAGADLATTVDGLRQELDRPQATSSPAWIGQR